MLDTGANVHVLNLRLAKALGMKLEPKRGKSVGVEANVPDFYFVPEPVSIRLPGMTLDEQVLLATSLDPSTGCEDKEGRAAPAAPKDKSVVGGEMNSVLGKALFDKFVVEIDYAPGCFVCMPRAPGNRLRWLAGQRGVAQPQGDF